ncbi:MAG: AraC family transcriptional regulator [Clostridia bacterium]|nr:AraC family transcriptional regulator [Clostridia bacterium]
MAFTNNIIPNEGYTDINPVQFGYENCQGSHSFGPAVRTYWLIHFVVSGFGIFKIDEKEYTVGPGEMFVIPPYVETYYEADSQNPWNYTWIGFTSEKNLPVELSDTIRLPEAMNVFYAMRDCENIANGKSAFLIARLWDLFALILAKKNIPTDHIKKALNFIHAEYIHDITVSQIAKHVNLDRTYFSALFKKETGVSPKQYLLNYRMGIAAALMVDSGISVSVAAYSVGYTDVFNFSKMFKKHFGKSPREYIKSYKII